MLQYQSTLLGMNAFWAYKPIPFDKNVGESDNDNDNDNENMFITIDLHIYRIQDARY